MALSEFEIKKIEKAANAFLNKGRRHVGHNGAAAPRVCVPANEVSEFIELLGGIVSPKIYTNMVA